MMNSRPQRTPSTCQILDLWEFAESRKQQSRFGEARAAYSTVLAALGARLASLKQAAAPRSTATRLELVRLRVLSSLGDLDRLEGRYADAAQKLEAVLADLENLVGPNHPQTAAALISLGVLRKYQGQYKLAEEVYLNARQILERNGWPIEWQLLYNLGGIAHAQGHYEKGERFARQALALAQRQLGSQHPEVAVVRSNLAANLEGQRRDDEAAALYRQSVQVVQRLYGPWHRDVAINLNNLAVIALRQADLCRAKALLRRSIRIKSRCLGAGHPELATGLNNLACVYRKSGEQERAGRLQRRAREILRDVVPPDHPRLRAIKAGLRPEKTFDPGHPRVRAVTENLNGCRIQDDGQGRPASELARAPGVFFSKKRGSFSFRRRLIP